MSVINKEPYITPEMIDKWNSGGLDGMSQLYSKSWTVTQIKAGTHDTTYHCYSVSDAIDSGVYSQITGSKFLFVSVIFTDGYGNNYQKMSEIIKVSDTTNGRFSISYSTSAKPYDQTEITNNNGTITFQIGDTIVGLYGGSAIFTVKIYKLA